MSIIRGDNKVNVNMGSYKGQNVRCSKKPANLTPWRSCVNIFGDIRAGTEGLRFGNQEDPIVQVVLPKIKRSGKRGNPRLQSLIGLMRLLHT